MRPMLHKGNVWGVAAAIATILASPTGSAQTSSDPIALQEIVVTARKREESLQDVPLSVTAISADTIAEKNINDIRDLAKFTPGLSYTAAFGRANGERPVVRGQSNIIGRANASFFVDGVFISGAAVTSEISNIERVEVIKGPQAAQYGRGTFAGAINYVTRAPSKTFEGRVSATYAEHDEINLNGFISGPINDQLSYVLSATRYEYGGEYDNALTGERLGDESTSSISAKLRWEPNERVRADFTLSYDESKDGPFALGFQTRDFNNCQPRSAATPRSRSYRCGEAVPLEQLIFAQRTDILPRDGGLDSSRLRGTMQLNFGLGDGYNIDLRTAYSDEDYKFASDVSYAGYDAFGVLDGVVPTIPVSNVGNVIRQFLNGGSFWRENFEDREDLAVELRVNSPTDKRLRWSTGAYYFRLQDDQTGNLKAYLDGTIVPNGTAALTLEKTVNTAIFGLVEYDLTDKWTAAFETRRGKDDISQVNLAYPAISTLGFRQGMGTAGVPSAVAYQQVGSPSGRFNSSTPRFSLRYEPNDDATLYATFARGNKPGGFNSGNVLALLVQEGRSTNFQEELVKSYEVGGKFRLLDGRAVFNVAVYHNDLFNQQLTQNIAGVVNGASVIGSFIDNVGETVIEGIEFDLTARLASNWDMSLGYSFVDAEIKEFLNVDQADLFSPRPGNLFAAVSGLNPNGCFPSNPPPGSLSCQQIRNLDNAEFGDVAGNVPPRAPRHQGFVSSRYGIPLANGWELSIGGDVTYEASKFAQVHNLLETGDRMYVNARIGLEGDSWTVSVWGKNLNDDQTALDILRYIDTRSPIPAGFSVFSSPRGFAVTPPRQRQFGLTASYRF